MSRSQFWRFSALVFLISTAVAGYVIWRDVAEAFKPRLYAYLPWGPVAEYGGYDPDAIFETSIDEVMGLESEDYFLNVLRAHGYRSCPMNPGNSYLEECFNRRVGWGRVGVTYPVKGSYGRPETTVFPAIVADGRTARVAEINIRAKNADFQAWTERIFNAAREQYLTSVRSHIQNRVGIWLSLLFGPLSLLLAVAGGFRWIRYGTWSGSSAS